MAQSILIPADSDITDIDFDQPELEKNQTDADKKTESLKEALNNETVAFVQVHKTNQIGGDSHCCRLPADKFDIGELHEHIRKTYGGGDYRIRVYGKGKSNKQVLIANKLITIQAPITDSNTNVTPGGEVTQILQTILGTIQNQQREMMLMVGNQNNSKREMIEELLLFKQLFDGQSAQPVNPLSQMREAIELMGTMGVEFGGRKDDDSGGFGDVIEKLTPLVNHAITSPRLNPSPRPTERAKNPMIKKLMQGLQTLLRGAVKGSDPAVYADLVCDQMPVEKIKDFLLAPGSAEKLVALDARVKDYAEWFDELAEHLKARLGLDSRYSDQYTNEDDDTGLSNDHLQPTDNPIGTAGDTHDSKIDVEDSSPL